MGDEKRVIFISLSLWYWNWIRQCAVEAWKEFPNLVGEEGHVNSCQIYTISRSAKNSNWVNLNVIKPL